MMENPGEDVGMVLGISNHDIKIPAQYYEKPLD
jgi:hypothetical protein